VTDAWQDRLRQLHHDGGGTLSLTIVDLPDMPEIEAMAGTGDAVAARIVSAVNDATATITTSRRSQPSLCAACNRSLKAWPFRIVLAHPTELADNPDVCSMAICRRCSPSRADVLRRAGQVIRLLYPEARAAQAG